MLVYSKIIYKSCSIYLGLEKQITNTSSIVTVKNMANVIYQYPEPVMLLNSAKICEKRPVWQVKHFLESPHRQNKMEEKWIITTTTMKAIPK